jgi:hypothetical protein
MLIFLYTNQRRGWTGIASLQICILPEELGSVTWASMYGMNRLIALDYH